MCASGAAWPHGIRRSSSLPRRWRPWWCSAFARTASMTSAAGRYRIGPWAAAALAWLSIDATTGLHDALGLAITQVVGKSVLGGTLAASCTATWLAVYGLLLGTLLIRLAIEVWSSLASFA